MKLGILTFNQEVSCGALLQAYALQQKLNTYGLVSEHIRRHDKPCPIFIPVKNCRNVLTNVNRIVHYKRYYHKMKAHISFMNNYIIYSDKVYNDGDDKILEKDYDGFIVGSDQVWNCANGLDDFFFLKNISSVKKKLSYAASIGLKEIPKNKEMLYKKYFSSFDYISVREESARKNLQRILNDKIIYRVIDPVMLYDKYYWSSMVGDRLIKERYVFVYATERDDVFHCIMDRITKNCDFEIIMVPDIKGYKSVEYDMGPLEFLNYIYYAEFVMTSSFHATAFSLIFNKPLVAYPHSLTGSRVEDLLYEIGGEKAIFNEDMYSIPKLNYEVINKKLDIERKKACNYIEMMLYKEV